MTRYLLAVLLLSGCAAVGVEAGAQSIAYVIGETTHEVAHACDCDSTKGPWRSCEDGAATAPQAVDYQEGWINGKKTIGDLP